MSTSRFYTRVLPALALIVILFATAYAFADANTVADSGAGDGQGTITGYNITAIRYTLNTTNPQNLDAVQFTVTPTGSASAPTTVKVQLSGAGSWFGCTNTAGTTWSCTLTGQTVLSATSLRVVAAQ